MIIDRFEENIAVCEDGENIIRINKALLPDGAREGDIIVISNGKYVIDKIATDKRRKAILDLQNNLWE